MATDARLPPTWGRTGQVIDGVRRAAASSRDAGGLTAFRALFGAVLLISVIRFVAKGWVEELYLAPSLHFPYLGFEWVRALPAPAMYGLFAVMGACALAMVVGAAPRAAAALFFAAFTYVELIDKTTYLNHYYFVSLMTFLLAVLPSRPSFRGTVPAYSYAVLRFQVAVVYVFAGLAKLDADWLLRAEPLTTWLLARSELPIAGALFAEPWFPFVMSWVGAAFDLTIVPLMAWRRARRAAYAAAVLFHGFVWLLFPIGVFSPIMLVSLTLFFDPSWPARFVPAQPRAPAASIEEEEGAPLLSRAALAALFVYAAAQVLVPLRFLLYPGDVNWTEQGFRFAWRVMLMEKTGHVEYNVRADAPVLNLVVSPRAELTPFQYRMLSTQPDMIHDYARRLGARFTEQGYRGVRVYANAHAALNGRPSQPLVDERYDLAQVRPSHAPAPWIVPTASW